MEAKKRESAGGVVLNNNLVLIVNQHGDSWSLPKGHIELGEGKIEAAKREIYEESGLKQLEFVKELGSYQRYRIGKGGKGESKSEIKVMSFFLFKTKQKKLKPVDPNISQARWIPKEKVAGYLTHPKDKEFYLSVLKQF